ncbi:MAG: hypothetical protein JWM53_7 [bacterium]|nr:hypothetical protein [bacterium]
MTAASRRTAALALALVSTLAATRAAADGAIKPGSAADVWLSATSSDEHGDPLIHSLRSAALELTNRARYRWRIGLSWRFRHPLGNGMPGTADRAPMIAIDDAIHDVFEHDDAARIVYFTTGGGIREVMLYAASESAAWARVDALFKKFPDPRAALGAGEVATPEADRGARPERPRERAPARDRGSEDVRREMPRSCDRSRRIRCAAAWRRAEPYRAKGSSAFPEPCSA